MSLTARFELNPVIVKELRSRMRGGRAFTTLTAALLLLASCSYGLYRLTLAATQYSSLPLSPQIGQVLFTGLVFIELLLISVIVPSVTANAISSEMEKQTYEMLLTTPLPPGRILWGKLIASLGYVFLLIFAAVPLASIVFVFGGVTLRDMLKAILVLCISAVTFGVIGLFMSALFKRSGRAVAATYIAVLALLLGPLVLAIGAGILRQSDPPRWIMIPSPISALGSSLMPSVNPQNLSSLFWMLGSPVYWVMGAPQISLTSIPRPIYHYSLPLYLGLTLILYLIATRLVKPARRWQVSWAETLVGFALLLGFAGLVTLGYAATANRYENIILLNDATPTPAMMIAPPEEVQPGAPSDSGQPYPLLETPTPFPGDPYLSPKGAALPDDVSIDATNDHLPVVIIAE
ncbi:MAG: hypothetical protein QME21_05385 [Anaerolineales bacterium]|nr:hypothetical protein [Anaerolineales bacterium]